jgi:hypothetical protein
VRAEGRYVLAALDGPPAVPAIRRVAEVMGDVLQVPVRTVHVVAGPGLRGEARRSALARVERGDDTEMTGRPEDVLRALVDAPGTALAVLGTRQACRRPGGRRAAGTALAVAKRVTKPLLLVPAAATDWEGPRRVLTPLDGTGITAMAAASALAHVRLPETEGIPLPVDGTGGVRRFWGRPGDDDAWHGEPRAKPADADHVALRLAVPPVGQQVLKALAETQSDLVVLVWGRRTRGAHGAAVLDVLSQTPVPVLLVPVTPELMRP